MDPLDQELARRYRALPPLGTSSRRGSLTRSRSTTADGDGLRNIEPGNPKPSLEIITASLEQLALSRNRAEAGSRSATASPPSSPTPVTPSRTMPLPAHSHYPIRGSENVAGTPIAASPPGDYVLTTPDGGQSYFIRDHFATQQLGGNARQTNCVAPNSLTQALQTPIRSNAAVRTSVTPTRDSFTSINEVLLKSPTARRPQEEFNHDDDSSSMAESSEDTPYSEREPPEDATDIRKQLEELHAYAQAERYKQRLPKFTHAAETYEEMAEEVRQTISSDDDIKDNTVPQRPEYNEKIMGMWTTIERVEEWSAGHTSEEEVEEEIEMGALGSNEKVRSPSTDTGSACVARSRSVSGSSPQSPKSPRSFSEELFSEMMPNQDITPKRPLSQSFLGVPEHPVEMNPSLQDRLRRSLAPSPATLSTPTTPVAKRSRFESPRKPETPHNDVEDDDDEEDEVTIIDPPIQARGRQSPRSPRPRPLGDVIILDSNTAPSRDRDLARTRSNSSGSVELLREVRSVTCPITKRRFQEPVISPCRHTFERQAVEQLHEENRRRGKKFSCPAIGCKTSFDARDLEPDREMAEILKWKK